METCSNLDETSDDGSHCIANMWARVLQDKAVVAQYVVADNVIYKVTTVPIIYRNEVLGGIMLIHRVPERTAAFKSVEGVLHAPGLEVIVLSP
jgi:hypothetical protein